MNANTSTVERGCEATPLYIVWNGEMMLDARPEDAWPHVINYPSWQNYSIVRHVSGEVGQEGEVMLLQKDEGGPSAPYFARTIKLDPGRRIIWKTFCEKGSQEIEHFGIVEFKVDEAAGKTRFSYNLLYEFEMPPRSESELQAFRNEQYTGIQSLLAKVLPKLRDVVERRPG